MLCKINKDGTAELIHDLTISGRAQNAAARCESAMKPADVEAWIAEGYLGHASALL